MQYEKYYNPLNSVDSTRRIPFSMFIQNCSNCSCNGFNSSKLNAALGSQNAGPMVPYLVGQTPWIVQISFGDGNAHLWFLFHSIHSRQVVTGHCCVNISKSNSCSGPATNSISFNWGAEELLNAHTHTHEHIICYILCQAKTDNLQMSSTIAQMQQRRQQCTKGKYKIFHHQNRAVWVISQNVILHCRIDKKVSIDWS